MKLDWEGQYILEWKRLFSGHNPYPDIKNCRPLFHKKRHAVTEIPLPSPQRHVSDVLQLLCLFVCLFCREADITKERIQKILATGANVILVSGGIDDLCLKYFVETGAMAVRRCKKADLKRIARATGGEQSLFFCQATIAVFVFSILG